MADQAVHTGSVNSSGTSDGCPTASTTTAAAAAAAAADCNTSNTTDNFY